MDEVWVPSHWQREAFIASGVDATKLRVVPEVGGPATAGGGWQAQQAEGGGQYRGAHSGWQPRSSPSDLLQPLRRPKTPTTAGREHDPL
jgi:hypothetical protein